MKRIYSWVTDDGSRVRWSTDATAADGATDAKALRKRVVFVERDRDPIMVSCHSVSKKSGWLKEDRKLWREYMKRQRDAANNPTDLMKIHRWFRLALTDLTMNWLVGNVD